MNRILWFVVMLAWCRCDGADGQAITTARVAGVEVVTVVIPATWTSGIVPATERERFLGRGERVLINGGYFDAAGKPAGLVIDGSRTMGEQRTVSPYSGFIWVDAQGALHIERTGERPTQAHWAVQSGPLLIEQGRVAIRSSRDATPRTVVAVRQGAALVVHTGRIGLKELAEHLATLGVDAAINLDGGPSSAIDVRLAGESLTRTVTVSIPYYLGFAAAMP